MKKIAVIFLICVTFVLSGFSQDQKRHQIIEKDRNKLYLVEGNQRFEVDMNVVTVKLKSSNDALDKRYKVLNIDPSGYIDIQVPKNADIIEFVEQLKQTGLFESVEYNGYIKTCTINDTYWSSQQYHLNAIHVPEAWKITMGSPSVRVAVIDRGIDFAHEDLGLGSDGYTNVSQTLGVNYTDTPNAHLYPIDNHGTRVAGIIGAKTNNNKGIAGIAGGNHTQGALLISYCTSSSYHIRQAIYQAIDDGVKVINISLSANQMDALDIAIQYAYNHNVSVVCASGNNGTGSIDYPASHANTIAVGASNNSGARCYLSQYGNGLDMVAPGFSIYTTDLQGDYFSAEGTSIAAPHVTGTIALMLSVNPTLTPSKIRSILQTTCTKVTGYSLDASGWNEEVGYGMLNVCAAVVEAGLKIVGPSLACTSTPYYVENLPQGMHVVWSLENVSCACVLETDTPSANQCSISGLNMPFHATLKASIYDGTTLFAVLTKYVYTLSNSYGTYSQESCWYYNVQHPAIASKTLKTGEAMFVHQGCTVTLNSQYFAGATVSHSGATPDVWFFDPINKVLLFSLPLYSGGIPMMIDVHGENSCGDVRFTFFSVTNNGNITSSLLNVEPLSNGYLLSINEVTDDKLMGSANDTNSSIQKKTEKEWNLEIYSAKWGNKMLGHKVNGLQYTLDTSNWESGIYVIRAVIGDEVYSQKITVN